MPRMLELIRNSQVPVNLMQSAARGSLSVPPAEMIEILVYLALHHKLFGPQARLTLAGWDENASLAVARDPATSAEVLGYFVALENLRPHLLSVLVENPSVTEESLSQLAAQGTRSVVEVLLASARVMSAAVLLRALETNVNLRPNELTKVTTKLGAVEASPQAPQETGDTPDAALEEALAKFLRENAAELEKEKDKPFQPIGEVHDSLVETASETHSASAETGAAAAGAVAPSAIPAEMSAGGETRASAESHAAADAHESAAGAKHGQAKPAPGQPKSGAAAAAKKHAHPPQEEHKRDSALQKIARLDVKGRIALAMRGNKEERSILIRDGTKLVAVAVLDSPKVSETEVEGFALQKNVLEAVLRAIPLKRTFAKNYSIIRNLVFNPRTPIDLALTLVKNLLVHDLKNLSGNKEVSETIRKVALRLFKQKTESRR